MERFFEIEHYWKDGLGEYTMNHRDGKKVFDKLCNSEEWEAQEDLIWTRGDDKIELVIVRLDFAAPEEYDNILSQYPNMNRATLKVWNQKVFTSVADFWYWLAHGERLDKLMLSDLVWRAVEAVESSDNK